MEPAVFARWLHVCTALHGKEKVWLSKPGGVAGAFALLYTVLHVSVAGMCGVAVYCVDGVRGCRFGIVYFMYGYVCVCIKCLWLWAVLAGLGDGSMMLRVNGIVDGTVSAVRIVSIIVQC